MSPARCACAFPHPEAGGLSGVFVNTAGGIAGGDRFDIDIAAGRGIAADADDGGGRKSLSRAGPAARPDISP